MTDDYDDHVALTAALRAWAAGSYRDEAAVELLIAHRAWLARRDFRRACLCAEGGYAWLDADRAARIADGDETAALPASSGELRILAIVAQLAGQLGSRPLGELVTGLDGHNMRLVLDAIAHASGWHERGDRHLVTGHLDGRTGEHP
ncbi:MAG: hypothetical protein GEV07_29405 [Streptosporangiales bacterium]|nr:hypothetical protein [Streptosporangiales bacterium]